MNLTEKTEPFPGTEDYGAYVGGAYGFAGAVLLAMLVAALLKQRRARKTGA